MAASTSFDARRIKIRYISSVLDREKTWKYHSLTARFLPVAHEQTDIEAVVDEVRLGGAYLSWGRRVIALALQRRDQRKIR